MRCARLCAKAQSAAWFLQKDCGSRGLRNVQNRTRDTKDFTAFASALVRKSLWRRAIAVLQEIPAAKLIPDSVSINASAAACAAGAHWVGALEMLDWHRRISSEQSKAASGLRAAMDACVKASQWQRALTLLPVASDAKSLAVAARAGGRGHQWQLVLSLIPEALRRDLPQPDVSVLLVNVLGALARSVRWQHACSLLFQADLAERSASSVSAATSACAEASRWEQALALLFCSHKIRLPPDQMNRINYNSALAACARGSRWHHALQLLASMSRGTALQPDTVSFSIVITACEKGGRTQEAMQLIFQMKELELTLDAAAFSTSISACEKSSRWPDALQLLSAALEASEADPVTFSAAMSACEKGTCWTFAVDLLAQMRRCGHQPTCVHYGSLLRSCRLGSAWQQAMIHLQFADGKTVMDTVCLTHVIYTLEDAGHFAGVLPILRNLEHQLGSQMALASRASRSRAHAASTSSFEVCQGYGENLGAFSHRLTPLRGRVRLAALEELRRLCQGSVIQGLVLESLCDLGRPCTLDTLEQFQFTQDVVCPLTASVSLARIFATGAAETGIDVLPLQAAASRLGVWTSVQFDRLPGLNRVEVTLGTHR